MKIRSNLRRLGLVVACMLLAAPIGCAGKPAPAPAIPQTTNLDPSQIRGGGGDPNARRDNIGKNVQEKMEQQKNAAEEAKDTSPAEKSNEKLEEKPEQK